MTLSAIIFILQLKKDTKSGGHFSRTWTAHQQESQILNPENLSLEPKFLNY